MFKSAAHTRKHQSLRSKNTLKLGKFCKVLKVTAKPKVIENLMKSWKKSI